MFKKITGGDSITAEHKYGRGFEFASYAVPVFSANAVFGTPDTSEGYFRRWLIVPFPNSFVGREDSTLVDRLTSPGELAGILLRAVRGARELSRLGRFPVPPSIADTRERFMEESDPVRAFMKECLEPGDFSGVTQKDVYTVYRVWAEQAGRQALSSGKLASRMAECGVGIGVTMGRKMVRGRKLSMKVVYGELVPVVPIPAGSDPDDPLAGLIRPPGAAG
jgi:putative DNA primase/helicase